MSRVMSFRDLQLVEPFKSMSEFDMLHPDSDELMKDALGQLGFDVTRGVYYEAAKHRDMMGKVGVGYYIQGVVSNDREFLNSRLCHPMERIVAGACHGDESLTRELASLMSIGSAMNMLAQDSAAEDPPENTTKGRKRINAPMVEEYLEPDYEEVLAQITLLQEIRDRVRGDAYDNWGNVKTLCYRVGQNA